MVVLSEEVMMVPMGCCASPLLGWVLAMRFTLRSLTLQRELFASTHYLPSRVGHAYVERINCRESVRSEGGQQSRVLYPAVFCWCFCTMCPRLLDSSRTSWFLVRVDIIAE